MLVCMDQLTWLNSDPEGCNRNIPFNRRNSITMADGQAATHGVETNILHLIQVSHPSIRYTPNSTDRLEKSGINLAPHGPIDDWLAKVLHHHNLRQVCW